MVSFHLTARGASHIKKNKECQDASGCFKDDKMAIAVVCDGHGGDDYVRSAIGAERACQIALKNIEDFVRTVKPEDLNRHTKQMISTLEASIISDWNEAVWSHYSENPFSEEEVAILSTKAKKRYLTEERIESAYGTTLIAVSVTHEFWFGIQIGDGKCVAVSPDGKFVQPIPWDDKCFLNATTSICDSEAINNFRYFYSEKLPIAVFVGSDGVDDCFSNVQQLNNLYKTVLYSFTTTGFDSAVEDLKDYLPRLSLKGSGDDVSIAAVLDLDRIGEIESVKDFDREKEKARIEENARKEAQKTEEERQRIEREHQATVTVTNSPKYCANCGAKLLPKVRFCTECGQKVFFVETNQKKEPQNTKTDKEDTSHVSKVVYDVEMVPGEGPRIVEVNINKPKEEAEDSQTSVSGQEVDIEEDYSSNGKDMTIIKVVSYDSDSPRQEIGIADETQEKRCAKSVDSVVDISTDCFTASKDSDLGNDDTADSSDDLNDR